MDENTNKCFKQCNDIYSTAYGPQRAYCKKGCLSDEDEFEKCKEETCMKLCIKEEIGTDDAKWGAWSKVFSRAPANSADCLDACFMGCRGKEEDKSD